MLVVVAISGFAARLLGVLAVACGLLVVRYSQRIGFGIADAIIRPPDLITDRRPPQEGLTSSVQLTGRCIGVFLIPWGALLAVAGVSALLDGRWG